MKIPGILAVLHIASVRVYKGNWQLLFQHCVIDCHAGSATDCAILIVDRNAAHRSIYHIVITLFSVQLSRMRW